MTGVFPFLTSECRGSKNSNQLKSTSSNSEGGERSHFLSAGTHPISNKSDWNSCIYDRARAFVQQEEMKKNLAAKTPKMCGKKLNI